MRKLSLVMVAALAAGCSKQQDTPPAPVKAAAEPAPAPAAAPAPAPAAAPAPAPVAEVAPAPAVGKPTEIARHAASKCIHDRDPDLERPAKFAAGDAKKGCDELIRALQDVIGAGEKQLAAINEGSPAQAAAGYTALGGIMVEGAGKFRALSGLDPSVGDARDVLARSFEDMGKLMIAFGAQLKQENPDGLDDLAQRLDRAATTLDTAVNGFVSACGG